MLRREGERGRERDGDRKGWGGVVNTGVRASDKVVWLGGKKLTSERKNNKIKVSFCADLLEDIFYEMYLTKRE